MPRIGCSITHLGDGLRRVRGSGIVNRIKRNPGKGARYERADHRYYMCAGRLHPATASRARCPSTSPPRGSTTPASTWAAVRPGGVRLLLHPPGEPHLRCGGGEDRRAGGRHGGHAHVSGQAANFFAVFNIAGRRSRGGSPPPSTAARTTCSPTPWAAWA